MNLGEFMLLLQAQIDNGDISPDQPVVFSNGMWLEDVQPCLYSGRTCSVIDVDDVDVGPGYVRAVALLSKKKCSGM